MSNENFSVPLIKAGTVIDQIPGGKSLKLLQLLSIKTDHSAVTVGMNLMSKKIGSKDIIKLSDETLSEQNIKDIAVFAPSATISVIKDFKVVNKIQASLPNEIVDILLCPNDNCVTHVEPVKSYLYVKHIKNQIVLQCKYCERIYQRDQIKESQR